MDHHSVSIPPHGLGVRLVPVAQNIPCPLSRLILVVIRIVACTCYSPSSLTTSKYFRFCGCKHTVSNSFVYFLYFTTTMAKKGLKRKLRKSEHVKEEETDKVVLPLVRRSDEPVAKKVHSLSFSYFFMFRGWTENKSAFAFAKQWEYVLFFFIIPMQQLLKKSTRLQSYLIFLMAIVHIKFLYYPNGLLTLAPYRFFFQNVCFCTLKSMFFFLKSQTSFGSYVQKTSKCSIFFY